MLNQASAIRNSVRLSYSTKYNNLIFLAKKILLFCWCCKLSWIYALASHHETIYIPQFFFCLHTLKGINVDGWCCQFLNEASYAGSIFPTFRNFHVRRNKGLILTDRQKFLLEKSRVNWMLPSFQKLCRSSLPIFLASNVESFLQFSFSCFLTLQTIQETYHSVSNPLFASSFTILQLSCQNWKLTKCSIICLSFLSNCFSVLNKFGSLVYLVCCLKIYTHTSYFPISLVCIASEDGWLLSIECHMRNRYLIFIQDGTKFCMVGPLLLKMYSV